MGTPRRPAGLSHRARIVGVVLALALQAALLWIDYRPAQRGLVGDETIYLETARDVREGRGTRSEALRPPFYSYLLAALDARPGNRLAIQIVQMAALLVAALALRSLTLHLGGTERAGDLAALALLLCPTLGAFAHYIWPEILHLALWVGALAILAGERRSVPRLLLAGVLLAVAVLLRHLLLVFVPLVALVVWLEARETPGRSRSALVAPLALLIPVLLLVAPAVWADWSHDGRLRSTSNVRFNLWVGLNDQSRKSLDEPIVFEEYKTYMSSADAAIERDEILEARIGGLAAEEGWPTLLARQLGRQYFRLFDKDTFFTEQLPGGALHGERRGYRLAPGVAAELLRWLDYVVYGGLLALAARGLAACRPRGSRWLQLILVFLAYNLAIFLLLHVKSRYRVQLTPFLILFAASGLDQLLAGARRLTPPRRLAALGTGAVLLVLAFAGPFF